MAKSYVFLKAFLTVLFAGSQAAYAQSDEAADWQATQADGTVDAYFLYLQRYPRGLYVEDAITFLQSQNALRGGDVSRVRSIKLY
ncbi:MAG: hypothetical protein AAFY31_14260 [Pseudomonadota bacterium]